NRIGRQCRGHGCPSRQQRQALPAWRLTYLLLVILIGLVQNSGCSSRRSREAVLEAIRDEQRRGNLDAALHDADRQYRKFEGHDSEWAWRFRIEKAHILVFQGAYNDALELLTEDLPDFLANSDVAVRRKIVQAIAHDAQQKYDDADRELNEAAKVRSEERRVGKEDRREMRTRE